MVTAALLPRAFVEENFDFYGRALLGTDELRALEARSMPVGDHGRGAGRDVRGRHFLEHRERMDVLVGRLIEPARESISLGWMSPTAANGP